MIVKLDMHCHSIASDGVFTMLELTSLAEKVGLAGLVLTDHCSPHDSFHTNLVILETLKQAGYHFPLPVIVGSEIKTPYGEFLLFGKKACEQWNQYKDRLWGIGNTFGVEQYWQMFGKFVIGKHTILNESSVPDFTFGCTLDYALAICHPRSVTLSWCNKMPDMFWSMLNGFEIQNDYECYDASNPDVVDFFFKKINRCKYLRNTDCHADELGRVYNEINLKEVTEDALIGWFRS